MRPIDINSGMNKILAVQTWDYRFGLWLDNHSSSLLRSLRKIQRYQIWFRIKLYFRISLWASWTSLLIIILKRGYNWLGIGKSGNFFQMLNSCKSYRKSQILDLKCQIRDLRDKICRSGRSELLSRLKENK